MLRVEVRIGQPVVEGFTAQIITHEFDHVDDLAITECPQLLGDFPGVDVGVEQRDDDAGPVGVVFLCPLGGTRHRQTLVFVEYRVAVEKTMHGMTTRCQGVEHAAPCQASAVDEQGFGL